MKNELESRRKERTREWKNLFKKIILLGAVFILCAALFLFVVGRGILNKSEPLEEGERRLHDDSRVKLDEDEYHYYQVGYAKYSVIQVNVRVDKGINIDIYILTPSEFKSYKKGENFTAFRFDENTRYTGITWTQPSNDDYCIVIDNLDNAHPSDAEPNGTVIYTMDVDDLTPPYLRVIPRSIEGAICYGGIFAAIALIIYCLIRIIPLKRGNDTQPLSRGWGTIKK